MSFVVSDLFRSFIKANAFLSDKVTPPIVHSSHAYTRYKESGEKLLRTKPGTVLDVGAGNNWYFAPSLKSPGTRLIGFDIELSEMRNNEVLDGRVVGDACASLGIPDRSVDLMMGRAVIEHLHDTESFLRNANNALREGGRLIVTFPNKYAPFAILNRLLPGRISRWLLANLIPAPSEKLGFRAYYNCTSHREFTESLSKAGFEIEEEFASYFSSDYFRFFFPLYLVALSYDFVCLALRRPQLASYYMFIARRGSSPAG